MRAACQVILIQEMDGFGVAIPGSSEVALPVAGPAHIDQDLLDMSLPLPGTSRLASREGFLVELNRPFPVLILAIEVAQGQTGRRLYQPLSPFPGQIGALHKILLGSPAEVEGTGHLAQIKPISG